VVSSSRQRLEQGRVLNVYEETAPRCRV